MKRSEWADIWWRQAKHDLAAARLLMERDFLDTCALMCQQAAEKAVKALWIDQKQEEPPKVHNVERLAAGLGAPDDVRRASNTLVSDYMAARYPDVTLGLPVDLYGTDEAEDRIAKAEEIMAWVGSQWEAGDGDD